MRNKRRKLTAIDLFCGAGGLSVGLKKAEFKVLAGVEIDSAAANTYKKNHRGQKLYQNDIREIDPHHMMDQLNIASGDLDLLAGCPPCQGFSTLRTKNKGSHVSDPRNDLIFEFLRFVRAMLPKTIMMENVPGLAKDARIKTFVNELKNLGYIFGEESVSVKDAANFGVPQRRKRMILLASRFGVLNEPGPSKKTPTVFDAISHLDEPGDTGDSLHDYPSEMTERIRSLIRLIPKNGGSRSDLPKEFWLPCHVRNPDGYFDVYGRMSWHDVAPTITGGCVSPSKGRFIHPSQDRAITLREAALLQTFPEKYQFCFSKGKGAVALMIGNSLPPELIRVHATSIKKHIFLYENRG